jgi:heparin/heparan-sulfate lyase
LPLARYFEGMGQVFMRSGWGANDTVALFTAGGSCDRHKHFDENTFAIYRKGFLALDTGTRPEPGSHLFQYYCRTVAHNGVLIRMDNERMPKYWGTPAPGEPVLPVANDGGMRFPTGAVIRAFHATPDFTYIASDATACYHPGKCRLALRQFVHIQPDIFVIFDHVQTVKPEQQPVWLLHTVAEPRVEADRFGASEQGGKIWCRTLLPRDAVLTKVGGPGRDLWSDGRNWPLPATPWLGGERIERLELLGGWRMEVSPSESTTDVIFLHVIAVGDAPAKGSMPPARCLRGWNWTGVELRCGERKVSVRFRKRGDVSCEVRIEAPGTNLAETLDNTIQPQSEWAARGR